MRGPRLFTLGFADRVDAAQSAGKGGHAVAPPIEGSLLQTISRKRPGHLLAFGTNRPGRSVSQRWADTLECRLLEWLPPSLWTKERPVP